jgi:hypothetical protein
VLGKSLDQFSDGKRLGQTQRILLCQRMSGGNFHLLTRLLTQIERILKVNHLDTVSKEIVAAVRDSLLIGQV